ncbi:NTF2-like protein [Paxillus ammoniavirescens]|nr:NTF2-like protein [Paxillus ammoniavirescens]
MTTAFTRDDIEISTRAADQFTRLYYSAYDSTTRVDDLPKFYRATSTLTWNGNPCQGVEGVKKLIQDMPSTKHEVQSYDCHPIPGSRPPSLLVTVAGNVTHGKAPDHPTTTPSRSVDGQPRVFFQTFMLVPDPTAPVARAGEVAKYYVDADSMRFVG